MVLSFPKEESLYVGKSRHKCAASKSFENVAFLFGEYENQRQITITRCNSCRKYIIPSTDYEKHKHILQGYTLISSSTNRPIPIMRSKDFVASYGKPRELEAPSHIQWAAMHPASGGRFSPK